MKGAAVKTPIAAAEIGKACVTRAVKKTLTGSDIVTIGIATIPSAVHRAKLRLRSALRLIASLTSIAEQMEKAPGAQSIPKGGIDAAWPPGEPAHGPPVDPGLWRTRGTLGHARSLLGKFLVRRLPNGRVDSRMITEVEAYDGERDLACHASRGRTERTRVLYGCGGIWYVYLCYGMHEMLNLVVGPDGWPAAVLIRGVEGAAGPGRVTRALSIDRRLNAAPAAPPSGLWIEDRGIVVPPRSLRASPRIGVAYAGPVWREKPWRFTFDFPPGRARAGGISRG